MAESRRLLQMRTQPRATVCNSGRHRPLLETVARTMPGRANGKCRFHAAISSRVSARIVCCRRARRKAASTFSSNNAGKNNNG